MSFLDKLCHFIGVIILMIGAGYLMSLIYHSPLGKLFGPLSLMVFPLGIAIVEAIISFIKKHRKQ